MIVPPIVCRGTPGHNKLDCRCGLFPPPKALFYLLPSVVTYYSFSMVSLCSQGEMIQKLLCRWWYAIEWPAKEDLKPAPPSYEALEGFPGVFICVEVRGALGLGTACRCFDTLNCVKMYCDSICHAPYNIICSANVECPKLLYR